MGRPRAVCGPGRRRRAACSPGEALCRRPGTRAFAIRRAAAIAALHAGSHRRGVPRPLSEPHGFASSTSNPARQGGACMKVVFFCHALTSCWNNGNAHFLRGIARELCGLGHEVKVYEPADGWSRLNALRDGGADALREAQLLLSRIDVRPYQGIPDLDEALHGADVVIVHEWNSPDLIGEIGRRRIQGAPFTLLFHDTHHRAVTAPEELQRFDLEGFDGVLAFGEVLRQIYLRLGWTNRAWTWHEAADTSLYRPMPEIEPTHDLIWIGNWGDGERSAELKEFLLDPAAELKLRTRIHGVRYPLDAIRAIETAGLDGLQY